MPPPISDVLDDLQAEYDRIDEILAALTPDQWEMQSLAPGWTVADTVLHLALTEELVVSTFENSDPAWTSRDVPLDDVVEQNVRDNAAPAPQILARWRAAVTASVNTLATADPTQQVGWAAAPLKPQTLATTRLAEHWAHALDITEPLRIDFPDTDRLRHIAWLGHATLPYALGLAGLDPVDVHCTLAAPSGTIHNFGPPDAPSTITGDMGAFCHVGARRLAATDSGLAVSGPDAMTALRELRNYAA